MNEIWIRNGHKEINEDQAKQSANIIGANYKADNKFKLI
jgi:hypothetical protein